MKYNITADGASIFKNEDEIRSNADGPAICYRGLPSVYRVAYNRRGWVTAVNCETGRIIQGWAGEFCAAQQSQTDSPGSGEKG